jgi:hypothetical protein
VKDRVAALEDTIRLLPLSQCHAPISDVGTMVRRQGLALLAARIETLHLAIGAAEMLRELALAR